ncbi:hypothetical protein [Paenibacillus rigui]|uniref:Uncharacterized protein n=1 Tax=Paenibacillus rigui TaxID=554312 RepID=A0A229UH98_9BACL|nr:hypothetical protein [Paenibacillus rigui]OXM82725.1 hypothetical protein CF651_29070 [Paenibacillus rigui]
MIQWIKSINLLWAFIVLFAFHGLLYYSLGTPGWFTVTLMASAVDTAVLAVVQKVLPAQTKQR